MVHFDQKIIMANADCSQILETIDSGFVIPLSTNLDEVLGWKDADTDPYVQILDVMILCGYIPKFSYQVVNDADFNYDFIAMHGAVDYIFELKDWDLMHIIGWNSSINEFNRILDEFMDFKLRTSESLDDMSNIQSICKHSYANQLADMTQDFGFKISEMRSECMNVFAKKYQIYPLI